MGHDAIINAIREEARELAREGYDCQDCVPGRVVVDALNHIADRLEESSTGPELSLPVEQRIQQFDTEAPFSFFGVPEDHPRHGWAEIDWLRWLATGNEPTEGAANGNEST